MQKILVVGAINIDIKGEISTTDLHQSSCNPGVIHYELGGVASNMIINLTRLGSDTSLLTYVGLDDNGYFLTRKLSEVTVDIENIYFSSKFPTGTYLSILNKQGDMQLAVADTRVMSLINKDFCERIWDGVFKNRDIIILDSNLLIDGMEYILKRAKSENKFTAINIVSAARAKKVIPLLKNIDFISLNKNEAIQILGKEEEVEIMAKKINTKGVKYVAVTLGKKGVVVAYEGKTNFLKNIEVEVIDTIGAGDAFLSGVIHALSYSCNFYHAAKFGLLCASSVVTLRENYINKTLSEKLQQSFKSSISH